MTESSANLWTLSLDGPDWHVYSLPPNEWRWRKVWSQEPPAAALAVPAFVPGHAQSALLAAGEMPHPYQGLNSLGWEWTSARDWVYTRAFPVPESWRGRRIWLRLEGTDGAAHLFLNGEPAGEHERRFVPAAFEVTGLIRAGAQNDLRVVVERAPDTQGQIGWTSLERRWMPRFAYGWDFAPRLPPVGICDSLTLRATGAAAFRDAWIHTNLSTDQSEAAVSLVSEFSSLQRVPVVATAQLFLEGLPVAEVSDPVTIFPPEISLVQSMRIPAVHLWWPNGCGAQPLYEARLSLRDPDGELLDHRVVPFGVRSIEFQPNEGAPSDSLPHTLVVNGRRLYVKGWNWVPVDLLCGPDLSERYERFLNLARHAGVNMLRVWGGGLLERTQFYNLCDRFGILVWQEFPLSSSGLDNTPPEDDEYLQEVEEQATAIVASRRNHPSLAIWSGGNELTGPEMQPLGSDHPALARLKQVVETEDPQRAWLPTSPTGPSFAADPERRGEMHDVHGPWLYLGADRQSAFYDSIDALLHSEFGCEGAAAEETLSWIGGEAGAVALWPPERTNPIWMHHGGDWWLQPETVSRLFGPPRDLTDFVRASQFVQAEGLRYAVESARRRKWRCSGTFPWQFNEPWPNAACTSAVDYFARPKPAYWVVRRAYRPVHVSAAYPSLCWRSQGEFHADIWMHNSAATLELLNAAVTICDLQGRVLYQENLAAEAPGEAAVNVGDVRWRFPADFAEVFLLHVEVIDEEGERVAENGYFHSRAAEPSFAGLLAAPATRLEATRNEGLLLRNAGAAPAVNVTLEPADGDAHAGSAGPAFGERGSPTGSAGPTFAGLDDSWFTLLPGAGREVVLNTASKVAVRAWNAAGVEL